MENQSEQSDAGAHILTDDLSNALIKYVMQSYRILIAHQPETWDEFHSENKKNFEKYANFSTTELCSIYNKQLLPKILNIELTEQEEHLLKLLDSHPGYKRTENGYVLLDSKESDWFDQYLQDGVHLQVMKDRQTVETGSAPQTLAIDYQCDIAGIGFHRSISAESSAIFSTVLLNELELANCTLLEPDELLVRLRTAKQQFQRNGSYSNADITALLEEVKKMHKLKTAVTDIISNHLF